MGSEGREGADGTLAVALESLDHAPATMAWLDSSLRIVRVNQAWRTFGAQNGATPETAAGVGLEYARFCPPEIAQALEEIAADQRGWVRLDYPCHAPDELRWITFEARRLRDGVLVLHVDHTAEHLLRARTRLQELVGQGLAKRASLSDLGRSILDCVGTELGWDAGRVWLVDELGVPRPTTTWLAPELTAMAERYRPASTQPMVDALMRSRESVSRADLPSEGDELALPVGLFVPMHDANEVMLILELRSMTRRPRDDDLVRQLESIGRQICAVARSDRLRERAARGERMAAIATLAAGVAHEINTPIQYVGDSLRFLAEAGNDVFALLRAMREAVATLASGPLEPAQLAALHRLDEAVQRADLDYLQGEVPRALARCEEGLSRVGQIVRILERFAPRSSVDEMVLGDLVEAVHDALTLARDEVSPVAELDLDLQPLPQVPCRIAAIRQVILSLVINAARAVAERDARRGPRGRVTVRTWAEVEHVVIAVSDDGDGIPPAIRERIFEPFFTTRVVGSGLGQGLAHAWASVVEEHRGTLTFATESEVGTTFFVRIPRAG